MEREDFNPEEKEQEDQRRLVLEWLRHFKEKGLSDKEASQLAQLYYTEMYTRLFEAEQQRKAELEAKLK